MRTSTLLSLLLALAPSLLSAHSDAQGLYRTHEKRSISPATYLKKERVLEHEMAKLSNETRVGRLRNKDGSRRLDRKQKCQLKELHADEANDRKLHKDRIAAIVAANKAKSASSHVRPSTATRTSKTSSKTSAATKKATTRNPTGASKASSHTTTTSFHASRTASHTTAHASAHTSIHKTSTTKSVAHSASSSPTSTSKKGLGYNTASFTNAFGDSLGWVYNWGNQNDASTGTIKGGVEFVPMLWGNNSAGWATAAEAGIAAGATSLLAFNEPDGPDPSQQSDMSPKWAAEQWVANLEPFHKKAVLVSPAITNGGAPMGATWMGEFLGNCTTCHVSAVACHWYDSADNIDYFTNYLTDLAKSTGKPLWLTEFMGSGTVAEQQKFLETVIPWLEKSPFIERYAAFGDFAGTFVDSTGALTALGITYKNTV